LQNAYEELEAIFRKVLILRSVKSLLRWDAEVMMPQKSHLLRAQQLSTLQTLTQELVFSSKVARLLKIVDAQKALLNPWQQVNVALMQHQYQSLSSLPPKLIFKLDKAIRIAESAWFDARADNNYKLFANAFDALLKVYREKANRLAEHLGCSPYEALMDEYDPGRKQSTVDNLLNQVKPHYPGIIQKAQARNLASTPIIGRYRKRTQYALCRELLRLLHFPMDQGRLDESVHPFTEGIAQDIRITTIFNRENPLQTLMGLMHELGHALYDNGLPLAYRFQLVGKDGGMLIHEGVALFWEKMLGCSQAFATWLSHHMQAHFEHPEIWTPENIFSHLTKVDPTLIRIEADEVCYMGHIILRYEIEKALFNDGLMAKDIPELWREKTVSLLGYHPQNLTQDCLQDIHWAHGYFGYFHTYGLGFLFAAQLFEFLHQHHPQVFTGIANGSFMPLLDWFKENLFQWGARFDADVLITQLTQSPLQTQPFITYLQEKYR